MSTPSIRAALAEAVAQVERHNGDYQHRTSAKQLEQWRAVLAAARDTPVSVPTEQYIRSLEDEIDRLRKELNWYKLPGQGG